MAKFAKKEDKPFDPISAKVLSSLASTPVAREPEAAAQEVEPPEEARFAVVPELSLVGPVEEATPESGEPQQTTEEDGEVKRPGKARKPETKRRAALEARANEPERLNRVVRCLLSPSEEKLLKSLLARLKKQSGTSLTLSHLMRPYFDLLLHSEDELAEEISQAELSRPHNDRSAIVHYEHKLAVVIHAALRKAQPFRTGRAGKKPG